MFGIVGEFGLGKIMFVCMIVGIDVFDIGIFCWIGVWWV